MKCNSNDERLSQCSDFYFALKKGFQFFLEDFPCLPAPCRRPFQMMLAASHSLLGQMALHKEPVYVVFRVLPAVLMKSGADLLIQTNKYHKKSNRTLILIMQPLELR